MPQRSPRLSVVVPVYRSTSTLPILVANICQTLRDNGEFEIILVDDGSPEATWAAVSALSAENPHVRGIRLGRNYGQHSALLAGIRAARYDIIVTIDDDLQNPPEEIPRLVAALETDGLDVVYGVPEHVSQTTSRRMAGKITRRAIGSGLGASSALDITSFRAFRADLRDAFAGELGTGVSIDALLTWASDRFGTVKVRHDSRAEGESNYSFRKLLRFAIDTATGYSAAPLQAASVLGFATAALGVVILIVVVARPLLTGNSVPGFPFLAATIAIFSGVQLLTLGVIGEYLARMHFRVMRKPTYFISQATRIPGAELPAPRSPETP